MKVDLVELGDAIHAGGDFFAETLAKIVGGDSRIFHDVMQQARLNCDGIHAHLGKNLRYGQRMREIGLARGALLARVMAGGELPGLFDAGKIVFGTGFANRCEKPFEGRIRRYGRRYRRCHCRRHCGQCWLRRGVEPGN